MDQNNDLQNETVELLKLTEIKNTTLSPICILFFLFVLLKLVKTFGGINSITN